MTIRAADVKGKVFGVVGLGRSGMAAARSLSEGGARVIVWDDNADTRRKAGEAGFDTADLSNPHSLDGIEAIILSPGIPHTYPEPHPVAKAAKDAGIPLISDIEILWRTERSARFIGITGTNGKSTTTALTGHILRKAGQRAEVGGNIGISALDLSLLGAEGSYVLELSSYQLELCEKAVFNIAVLLNITPDHLDRHGGMDGYIAAKMHIFDRQTEGDTAIVAIDDERTAGIAEALTAGKRRVIPVSGKIGVPGGVYVENGILTDDTRNKAVKVLDLNEVPALPGAHNAQNAAAAYAVAVSCGLDPAVIAATIRSFPGLAHRQQRVAAIDGVLFVNDSKATNADATERALSSYERIFWIAGGREKEGGYANLEPYFGRIEHAFLIGEAAHNLAKTMDGKVAVTHSGTIEQAVIDAFVTAKKAGGGNAVVLLSPACASFDQFNDFEERGRVFVRAVHQLPGNDRRIYDNGGV